MTKGLDLLSTQLNAKDIMNMKHTVREFHNPMTGERFRVDITNKPLQYMDAIDLMISKYPHNSIATIANDVGKVLQQSMNAEDFSYNMCELVRFYGDYTPTWYKQSYTQEDNRKLEAVSMLSVTNSVEHRAKLAAETKKQRQQRLLVVRRRRTK